MNNNHMIEPGCPLCGGHVRTPVISAGDVNFGFEGTYDVVRCLACDIMYTHPCVSPDQLMRYYPGEYAAHASERASTQRISRRRRDPWDRLPVMGRKRLLDIGCGSGAYLLRMQRDGWSAYGVEPSASAVAAARAHGLNVVVGVVPGAILNESVYEAITLMGVLGCIPRPMDTLRAARQLLVPGGTLIVTGHNAGSAARARFGPHWHGWDLPRHYTHFTADSLTRMIAAAGFHDVRISYKRRTAAWRHLARAAVQRGLGWPWTWMSQSRQFCSLMTHLWSRGPQRDELIAVARG